MLPASEYPGDVGSSFTGRTFPSAMLICSQCGYTMTFNLFYLGVAGDLGLKMEAQERALAK